MEEANNASSADKSEDDADEEGKLVVVHDTPTKGKSRKPRGVNERLRDAPLCSGLGGIGELEMENLTKTNVKSIIYNVIKDVDVQKMLANTLQEDAGKLEAATYEPKMTRAKMKQVLAQEGNIPYPWPLNPVKSKKSKSVKYFTDLEFPEDDNDEDYNPEKDLADCAGMSSDEDNESLLSAHASDVGSPMPSTSMSPQVSGSPSLVLPVMTARHENLPQVCMGPPPKPPTPVTTSQESERRFLDALDQLDLTDAIAKRTRSQLPLSDTCISSIEADFIPPDVTLDMYEEDAEQDEDPDWKDFLQNLLKEDTPMEDEDDPEADPEYNVLAEPEGETEEDHLLPTKVHKSEINQLMEELYESEWLTNDEDENSQEQPASFNTPTPLPVHKLTCVSELIEMKKKMQKEQPSTSEPKDTSTTTVDATQLLPTLTPYERIQLQRQMESFVQILCQQAIIGQKAAPELHQQCFNFLNELSVFASRSPAGTASAYNVRNLQLALDLVGSYTENEDVKDGASLTLTPQQMSTLALSPVFIYPELLPSRAFKNVARSSRVKFHHAEDVLICMGLEEFTSASIRSVYDLISELLMPVFSGKSISHHIHNESKKGKGARTTIGMYRNKQVVPMSIPRARNINIGPLVPPSDRPHQMSYPHWLQNVTKKDLLIITNAQITSKADKPAIVASMPLMVSAVATSSTQTLAGATVLSTVDAESTVSSHTIATDTSSKAVTKNSNLQPPNLDSPAVKTVTPEKIQTPLKVRKPPSILGILSGLSEAFAGETSDEDESVAELVTPKKASGMLDDSPEKSPAKKWRKIVASGHRTPEKQYTPIDPNWKMRHHSPRRKELRTKAQAIVPKSFVPTVYAPSPTKKAAKAISEKALSRASNKGKYLSPLKRTSPQKSSEGTGDNLSDNHTASSVKRAKSKVKSSAPVEDDMFPSLIESTKSKTTRKHRRIACLAADIVEKDPQRIEREELFSRWYINKVKDTLGENSAAYTTFLEALINFGNQKKNPAVFYGELRDTVFKEQEELLQGFAAFLLPAQALACGERCYKDCVQFNRARRFLRRIEVYFGAQSKLFIKLMKLLRACDVKEPKHELRSVISGLLKTHPTLLDEFNSFFPDAPPPKRHQDDYEELDLTEYEETTPKDHFEEMEVAEGEVTNATPACKCTCHEDEERHESYRLRKRHCSNCSIAVLQRRLFIHAGPSQGLRPAYIRYLDEEKQSANVEPSQAASCKESQPASTPSNQIQDGGLNSSEQNPLCASCPWTREEDKFILEAMQQTDSLSLSDDALFVLSSNLKNRSTEEVQKRFDSLVQLLTKQLSGSNSSPTK